jgi:hypothetical protein
MSKNFAVVIAHYDPDGVVSLDLLDMISALKKRTNNIIFVSTSINKESALIVDRPRMKHEQLCPSCAGMKPQNQGWCQT